ncbi:hypothetical protein [Cohnella sp.]|uniref:hypothetical protein n=1 Tax=Cohnella sp. TaxID=1883426 RepID=UPI003564EB10
MLSAVMLWISATVLWWSGWREEAAEGIPHWAVGVFLAGWPFTLLWEMKLSSTLTVNGAWIWTLAAFITLAWRIQPLRRWTALSAGVLLGSIYLLLGRLSYYPFALSHFLSPWGLAIVLGCLSALLLRNAPEQLIAVTISLFLIDGITDVVLLPSDMMALGKSSEWVKGWWIAVLCARLWSVSMTSIKSLTTRWALRMGWRRGGQRS